MSIEFGNEDKKNKKEIEKVIPYPCVQGIGWIPYFPSLKSLGDLNGYSLYANKRWNIIKALNALFKSGNTPEPCDDDLQTHGGLDEFLKKKNYRGLLAIRNLELYCFKDGTYEIYGEYLPESDTVGFTPFRSFLPLMYIKGVCGKNNLMSREYELDGILVSHEVHFQICFTGNLVSKFLTGYYAPIVKMRVNYYLKYDGSCSISLTGSYIPSQKWHVFKNGTNIHDMLVNTKENIADFLEIKGFRTISQTNYPSIKIAIT